MVSTYLHLYVLLYADDTILLAESPEDLQNSLNTLHDYCKKWKLTVNMDKTNIVVFSKGKVTKVPAFTYGSCNVSFVHSYTYLGVIMKYNNNFDAAMDKQISQANRALNNLLMKATRLQLPVDIIMSLYNILVIPVLLYGCEVWGASNIDKVETFQRKFMKRLLKVNYRTPTCMIYAELGILPVKYIVNQRILNYWCRILTSDTNKLSCIMYQYLLCKQNSSNPLNSRWLEYVQNSLTELNLSHIWNNPPFATTEQLPFKRLIKIRCRELFQNQTMDQLQQDKHCHFYNLFKCSISFESYLTMLDHNHAKTMSKWRCRDHHLPINNGRYGPCPQEDLLCNMCSMGEIGDESHFLLRCNAFTTSRKIYLHTKYMNSSNASHIKEIMSCNSKHEMLQLSRFVNEIMEKHVPILKGTREGKFLKRIKISRYGRIVKPNIDENMFVY